MRNSLLSAVTAVIALPLTTLAATLNDWEPRLDLDDLSPRCKAVYTGDISGCSAGDFQQGASCNAACVKGLQEVAAKVKTACGDEDFGDDTEASNILLCFIAGNGPERVCRNNAVAQTSVLSSSSSMGGKTTTASSTTSSKSAASTTSSKTETSTTTSSSSETSMSSSTDSSSTERVTSTTPTSPTTTLMLDTTTVTSSATPEPSSSQDNQGDSSGGGSPFDDVSWGVRLSIPIATTVLVAVMLVAGMC